MCSPQMAGFFVPKIRKQVVMAERRVSVKFSAEISNFKKAMADAAAATKATQKVSEEASQAADNHLGRLVQSADKNREAWDKAGGTMLGFGAAAVAGLALAGKAAVDWESAWAGVTKTVDGSPEQMAALEGELRNLAKTLPAAHEEIAAVAEAAGQLGVKREDVAGFTKTMVDLGETTNLTADEAATSIAQISNVMGTMERDGSRGVERFGATLVALGNAGASTEAEILDMAKRIAGAAKLVGASESDVLALSNAMASVGIEAQLGGGVISRVMQRMYADVKDGGDGLTNLAKVAGVSSKEFATAFETDPVRAVDSIVKGLGRVKDSGGDVIQTMSDLGIKGTEETGVILRLAGAGDLLADSLKLGDSAWKSNSALANEAAKRYETTESKVKIAWNNIKDAAIDAGAVLLPMISGVAESVAGIAQAFGNLPDPVKGALTVLGGVAGVAALGAGAFLSLTPKILDSVNAFNELAPAGGKARSAVGKAGAVAGVAAAAYAALATAATLAATATDNDRSKTSVEDFNNALTGIATNGDKARDSLDAAFNGVTKPGNSSFTAVNDLESAMKRIFNPQVNDNMNDFFSTLSGNNATSGINSAKDAIGNLDKAIASMASSGNIDDAAAGFRAAAEAAEKQGKPIGELVELFPAYKDAVLSSMTANGETQVSQEALTEAMLKGGTAAEGAAGGVKKVGEASAIAAEQAEAIEKALEDVGLAADGSVTDIDKFTQALFNAGLIHLSASSASIAHQAAIDALTDSVTTNGTTLDINTEKGRANREAFNNLANAAMNAATATATETLQTQGSAAAQAQLQGSLRTSYDDLVRAAGQFGITGEEADTMARKALGIPKNVNIDAAIQDHASGTLQSIKGQADGLDGRVVNTSVLITYSDIGRDEAMARRAQATAGGFTGGRVRDLMGFVDGGIVPGTPPSDPRMDNILAMVGGEPLKVRSGEWIINEPSSKVYDRELAAINAGTFPKLPGFVDGGRAFAAQSYAAPASAFMGDTNVTVLIGGEAIDPRLVRVVRSELEQVSSIAGGRAR